MSSPKISPPTPASTSTPGTEWTELERAALAGDQSLTLQPPLDARAHAGDGSGAARAVGAEPPPPLPPAPPALPARVPLRRKGATLTALRASADHLETTADDRTLRVRRGDWVIYNGPVVIAVLTDADFPGPFEIVAEGTLILSQAQREALEATTGVGTTRSFADLLAAVQRLARIGIGDVQIPFTPGQLEEITYRARKRGISVARATQDVVDRIKDELFHHS